VECVTAVASTLGPAVGYIAGGALLSLWVDLGSAPKGLNPDSPGWVGAWWLPFVASGVLLMLISLYVSRPRDAFFCVSHAVVLADVHHLMIGGSQVRFRLSCTTSGY
jgi:hypothetical protein